MRLLFAGTPQVAIPSLEALEASPHEIVAVLTRPDAPSGRGRKLLRSPVAQWADERGITVLQPAKVNDEASLAALGELDIDCAPVVAYGSLVGPRALAIPRHGWVNLHFSLLPAWRGAAPVQHALLNGDDLSGASTFLLEQGLDTGPVFGAMIERVRPADTSGDLLSRLAEGGAQLLVATLDGIEAGVLEPKPQPLDGVSLAPKITSADARIDWAARAVVVDRLVRAVTPEPGAWTTFRDERLGLEGVSLLSADERSESEVQLKPGQLLVTKNEVRVATHDALVRITQVRPPGKRAMAAADWARGARIEPGECLV